MTRLLKKICLTTILIGTIAILINSMFGYNTITFIERYRPNNSGLWFYKFNFKDYIFNLRTSFDDTTRLSLQGINRTWDNTGDLDAIVNNLAYILDVLILGLNIVLYPFRVGAYVVKTILAIIGVQVINTPSTNGLKWLIDLINFLQTLQIPMV